MLTSEADKFTATSNNKLNPEVSGSLEIISVRNSTLKMLEYGTGNIVSIDRAKLAPGLHKSQRVSDINDNVLENRLLARITEKPQPYNIEYAIERVVRYVH